MPEIYFPNLGLKINHLNRVAFQLFGVDLYWYGLIIVSAMIIAYFSLSYVLKKRGENIDDYLTFFILEIVLSFIGARCYYVIFSWAEYKDDLIQIFNIRNGGLGVYGGVITALLVAIIYCKITKKNFYKLCDLFVPYLALGQAMGRWGNFINREAFGGYTNSLFAMAYRLDTVRYIPQGLKNNIVEYFGDKYLQVQPTFLYESICTLCIFIFLMYKFNHKHFDGELLFSYMILYSFCRFFIEGLRTDQLLFINIPISQIVAICLFIIGIILFIINLKRDKEKAKN